MAYADNFRRRVWVPLLAAAELRSIKIKSLRHGYASRLLAAGYDIKFVQAQLGHHSPSFTLDTYVHLLPDRHPGLVILPKPVTQVTQGTPTDAQPASDSPSDTRALDEKTLAGQGF